MSGILPHHCHIGELGEGHVTAKTANRCFLSPSIADKAGKSLEQK